MTDEKEFMARMRNLKSIKPSVKNEVKMLARAGKVKAATRKAIEFNNMVEKYTNDLDIPPALKAASIATMMRPPRKR